MKFLHLSDLHFLLEYPQATTGYHSIFNSMTHPIEQLKKGLTQVSDYDAVLISGDLVESGRREDYEALKEQLLAIFQEKPIIITLGNHDKKQAFYEGWLGLRDDLNATTPYNHVVTVGDTAIICLDNAHPDYPQGRIDEAQCQWLSKTLNECDSKQIILMMHHHLNKEQISIPHCIYDDMFSKLVSNSRIDVILCGHTHHAYEGTFANVAYFTPDSLSFSGEDTAFEYVRFEERSGFNYGELLNNKVSMQTIKVSEKSKFLANVTF